MSLVSQDRNKRDGVIVMKMMVSRKQQHVTSPPPDPITSNLLTLLSCYYASDNDTPAWPRKN